MSSLTSMCGAFALTFAAAMASPGSVTAAAQPSLIADLPPLTTEYISLRHLLGSLAWVQHSILSDHIARSSKAKIATQDISVMKNMQAVAENVRDGRPLKGDVVFEQNAELGVEVVDLKALTERLQTLHEDVRQNDCPSFAHADTRGEEAERHNFLVHYALAVQRVCAAEIAWKPSGQDQANAALYGAFFQNEQAVLGQALWPPLHRYLGRPENQTYPIQANIFLAIYFQYLELSIRARYVTLALNEFVVPSRALRQDVPELDILMAQLNFGLVAGYFK